MILSSYISIISYSAIICFVSFILYEKVDGEDVWIPITGEDLPIHYVFIFSIVLFFLIKYMIDTVYNSVDEATGYMLKR